MYIKADDKKKKNYLSTCSDKLASQKHQNWWRIHWRYISEIKGKQILYEGNAEGWMFHSALFFVPAAGGHRAFEHNEQLAPASWHGFAVLHLDPRLLPVCLKIFFTQKWIISQIQKLIKISITQMGNKDLYFK